MEDAVIVSAVRTPVGSFGGQFKDVAATELGAHAVRAALERAEIAGDNVDEVVDALRRRRSGRHTDAWIGGRDVWVAPGAHAGVDSTRAPAVASGAGGGR